MSEPVPIRAGVTPSMDVERELFDYAASKITDFKNDYGTVPEAIAIVLLGRNDHGSQTVCATWSPEDKRTRFETCALGATLLTKRANAD